MKRGQPAAGQGQLRVPGCRHRGAVERLILWQVHVWSDVIFFYSLHSVASLKLRLSILMRSKNVPSKVHAWIEAERGGGLCVLLRARTRVHTHTHTHTHTHAARERQRQSHKWLKVPPGVIQRKSAVNCPWWILTRSPGVCMWPGTVHASEGAWLFPLEACDDQQWKWALWSQEHFWSTQQVPDLPK